MTPVRCSLLCVLIAVAGACHGDAVTNSPVIPSAAVNFVNAVPDTNKMAFRVVDMVSNAGLFGATFRTGNTLPIGIQAGARHIRVFFDTTDVVLAKTVLVDTTYTFTADEHYSFFVAGFARAAPLRALIFHDGAPPTVPAGKFAIRFLNLAPSFAGADPTLADTTVLPDVFVAGKDNPAGGSPVAVGLTYGTLSPYAMVDTGTYRVALTATGTAGPTIVQAPVPVGVVGSTLTSLNPIAGSGVSGSVLTAVIVPRSVVGSTAPQGGRPSSKTVESTATSNDTVTIQSGSITVVTNRSGGKADTTIAKTGTGASTGVGKYDNVLVTGATGQPEYNGWQTVTRVADSLSCNPTDPADTPTKCAAANDTATTRFRFRYHTGAPASPATGTVVYRIYPPLSASDYTIPYIFFLVDDRPPDTVP